MKSINFPFLFVLSQLFSHTLSAQLVGNENKIDSIEKWSCHFQLTTIIQGHPGFKASYSGPNSLVDTSERALSLTTTLFLGMALWKNAAFYYNPEIAGGNGISYALGLAGAANGETFRIGSQAPAIYTARAYFQQYFPVGNCKYEKQEAGSNQLACSIPTSRFVLSIGKFSVADFYDKNKYSHDPRGQFMNWSLMSNGAWDYPANTRGYTWGGVLEYINPLWAFRISSVLVPALANGPELDWNYAKAHSETFEIEKKTSIKGHGGSMRLLGFYSQSRAPEYSQATKVLINGDSSLLGVFTGKKRGPSYGGIKYGLGLSIDQELSDALGVFLRASWNDGYTATWAFTEIDKSLSLGLNINAKAIKRPNDNVGIAFVINGISKVHRDFLNAGGTGFIIGDGKLNHYNFEEIAEVYYKAKIFSSLWLSGDYQFVTNPAYNTDRGPVHIFALRAHVEF
jgi:high affinity Mn2+ porin